MLTTRSKLLICIAVVVILFNTIPRSSAPLVVDLGYARYQGVRNRTSGTTTFYGLNYAAPPTGALRWQAPSPVEAAGMYTDHPLINATSPGNICHQSKPTWQKFKSDQQQQAPIADPKRSTAEGIKYQQSEDCLKLDVIIPSRPASAKLPVVVFIHGGGFVKGYAAQYDGRNFVSFSKGSVVWVQIHYRLGLFGFLGGNDVRTAGTPNAGLLDQQLALQWVQKHVSAFGGDPDRVTIWGGSAGGASVLSQMVLHGDHEQPPFRAAIAEYPWWQPHHSDGILEVQYKDLLTVTNCRDISCLRRLDESALVKAQRDVFDRGWEAAQYGYGDFYLGPSVDGKVIPCLPYKSLETGKFAKVPMILDHAGFEGFIFTNKFINHNFVVPTYLERLWPQASKDFLSDLLKLYREDTFEDDYFDNEIFEYFESLDPLVGGNSAFYRAQTIFADATINCPTRNIAKAVVKAGQNIWKMQFNAGTQLHASVTKDFLLSTETARTTAQMRSYFLSFITSRDPNGRPRVERPAWHPYSNNDAVLVVNDTGIIIAPDGDLAPVCDFLAANHEMVGN